MLVKCINADRCKYLTTGKTYKVVVQIKDSFYIKTDMDRVIRYPKDIFEVVNVL